MTHKGSRLNLISKITWATLLEKGFLEAILFQIKYINTIIQLNTINTS